MSDEDIIAPELGEDRSVENNYEKTLEMLIALAQSERRDFLAYLLHMALIEARNEPDRSCLPH